jgi:hypothetical protein
MLTMYLEAYDKASTVIVGAFCFETVLQLIYVHINLAVGSPLTFKSLIFYLKSFYEVVVIDLYLLCYIILPSVIATVYNTIVYFLA